jgi:hypothetical protein
LQAGFHRPTFHHAVAYHFSLRFSCPGPAKTALNDLKKPARVYDVIFHPILTEKTIL